MTTATISKKTREGESKFHWPLCYEAENFILGRIEALLDG